MQRDGGKDDLDEAGDHGSSGIADQTMDDTGARSSTRISVSTRITIPAVIACLAKELGLFSVRKTMANIAPGDVILGIASANLRKHHGFRWAYGLHWSFYACYAGSRISY